jgi:hypothetical protein
LITGSSQQGKSEYFIDAQAGIHGFRQNTKGLGRSPQSEGKHTHITCRTDDKSSKRASNKSHSKTKHYELAA